MRLDILKVFQSNQTSCLSGSSRIQPKGKYLWKRIALLVAHVYGEKRENLHRRNERCGKRSKLDGARMVYIGTGRPIIETTIQIFLI